MQIANKILFPQLTCLYWSSNLHQGQENIINWSNGVIIILPKVQLHGYENDLASPGHMRESSVVP